MKTARIVVGSNNGDEGKGTVVAKYTKESEKVLNILTNGGSQRGHSVITDIGEHTFQHFGSGTYYGAANYYSSFFILNPMQFVKEWNELVVKPVVTYRDVNCRWSTPFDMIANSIMEELKGSHASCRMGIWNTITRYKETSTIGFDHFCDDIPVQIRFDYLMKVKSYYEKNITIPDKWKKIWNDQNLVWHFIDDCTFMFENTIPVSADSERLFQFDNFIFENGQGLLLKDTGKDTYDTTPSDTGISYSKIIMNQMGLTEKKCNTLLHYVTRPYLTRHGDGEFSQLNRAVISTGIKEDRTNHFNEGQGEFKYSKLDIGELKERIEEDCGEGSYIVELTHCDEMDRESEFKKSFSKVITNDSPKV